MSGIVTGQQNDKQRLFLKSREKHIAFGGARGGGEKSWAVRAKAKLLVCNAEKGNENRDPIKVIIEDSVKECAE